MVETPTHRNEDLYDNDPYYNAGISRVIQILRYSRRKILLFLNIIYYSAFFYSFFYNFKNVKIKRGSDSTNERKI